MACHYKVSDHYWHASTRWGWVELGHHWKLPEELQKRVDQERDDGRTHLKDNEEESDSEGEEI